MFITYSVKINIILRKFSGLGCCTLEHLFLMSCSAGQCNKKCCISSSLHEGHFVSSCWYFFLKARFKVLCFHDIEVCFYVLNYDFTALLLH